MKAATKKISPVQQRTIVSWAQWQQVQTQYRQALKAKFYRQLITLRTRKILNTPGQFTALPITTKADLVEHNMDFLAVSAAAVCEWVTTSGTTGKSVRIALDRRDLLRLAQNEAAALRLAGIKRGDGLLIAVGMDRLFVAGLAYWLGAQKLGAVCLRAGPSLVDMACTAALPLAPAGRWFIIGVPSLLSGAIGSSQNLPPRLGGLIGIGEALYRADLTPNAMCQLLHRRTGAPVMSTYASTETCSTFAQGTVCRGNHLNPRMAIVEILDDGGRDVPPGAPGRVVITPLGQSAMPLLRFDTGDIAALFTDPCPCGRPTARLGPVLGRAAQLLKLQGVSLFAAAVIELVRSIYAGMEFVILADADPLGADRVTVYVVCPAHRWASLQQRFDRAARGQLKCVPPIRYCDMQTIMQIRAMRPSRKSAVFVDTRD